MRPACRSASSRLSVHVPAARFIAECLVDDPGQVEASMQLEEALHARTGEGLSSIGSDAGRVESLIQHHELKASVGIPCRHLALVEHEPREIRMQEETLAD